MPAGYYRGFLMEANTNGVNKGLVIRDADSNSLHAFTGPAGLNTINHARQSQIEYAFSTPFVAHLCRYEPSADGIPLQVFGDLQWVKDPWPELSTESSQWFNCGTPGAKYMRGFVIPLDTNGSPVIITVKSSDGGTVSLPPVTTTAGIKTPTPFAFSVPLIGHEFQLQYSAPCRAWMDEIRCDYDPWPELITEASGWLDVLPGGAAGFLQGLIVPVEAAGSTPSLFLLTDTGPNPIPLISIRTPLANVKTPIPYSLAGPLICHQVQLIPSAPCRVWLNEIQWIAEATPEQALTWVTQPTAHGMTGYHSVLRVEASYTSTAAVNLSINSFDGTSPAGISLPSTAGAKRKLLLTPTFNKGQLFSYSAVSTAAFQIFLKEWVVWIGGWGRSGSAKPYNLLGGAFDDKAVV